jgi:hypothetical protein
VVAQPTALLRAEAVQLGEFALYESVDTEADGVAGTLELRPAPLVCGEPFSGRVTLHAPADTKVRGVRAELRLLVEATVSQGESQTITLWSGELGAAPDAAYDVTGTLPATPLPTVELPHGRSSAVFHVILDRPLALDTHLKRDVALATTAEI